MKYDKWLVIADNHIPYHDKPLHRAILRYATDVQPAGILFLGDFLDFPQVSRWAVGKPGTVEGMDIQDDVDMGHEVLRMFRKACPKSKMVYLEGNHEYRLKDYAGKYPALRRTLELPRLLSLKELGVKYLESWSAREHFFINDVMFAHGWSASMYAAKVHAMAAMHTVVFGHIHKFTEYPLPKVGGPVVYGASIGTTGTIPQSYNKGGTDSWEQGFAVYNFPKRGNGHQGFNVKVETGSGRFLSPEGVFYDGKR